MARHKKLEPIRLEDLEEAVLHSGLETALRFETPKITNFPSPADITTSDVVTPDITPPPVTPDPMILGITTPVITTPVAITPVKTAPAVISPVVMLEGASALISGRPYLIHRCHLAQDGHSRSEQILYDVLWRSGEPVPPGDFRLTRLSMKDLARAPALQMTEKNLRIALQRLVEKLSIEEAQTFDPRRKTTRVWKVYSYKSILERRAAAGMEWIIRDRGVRFINPKTTPVRTTPVVIPEEDKTTPVRTNITTPLITTKTTGDITTSPSLLGFSSRKGEKQTSTTTAAPPVVAASVTASLGFVDDAALRRIVRECRDIIPDATDEEIAELAGFQAQRIARMRNIDNPVGLLIDQVPKCFVGEPFARYRRQKAEQARRLQELYDDQT
jgi:hypothetical protein